MKPQTKRWAGVGFGSAALVAFIAAWEGGLLPDGSSVVYADKLANNIPTVCNGLTHHVTSTPIVVGERWPKEKCQREMSIALSELQYGLQWCFRVQPPQAVFDAATSFAWNVGLPAACKSRAMQLWKAAAWTEGCNAMLYGNNGKLVWVYSGGKFRRGLKNRREAEVNQCLQQ